MTTGHLNITRFIAAIIVVIFHFGLGEYIFQIPIWSFIFSNGPVFVSYFFVLSGFVMCLAYPDFRSIDKTTFYVKRFARLYPVYSLAIVLLIASYWVIGRKILWPEVFLQSLMVHAWIPRFSMTFNYVAWSLVVEVFFYLLFPFLISWKESRYFLGSVIFFWVFTQCLTVLARMDFLALSDSFLQFHPLMHLNEFLIGIFAGTYFSKGGIKGEFGIALLGISVFMLVLLYLKLPLVGYRNGFLAPVFAVFIYLMARDKKSARLWDKPLPRYLGEASYAIYILQVPVYYLSKSFFKDSFHFSLYFGVLIVLAMLSFFVIEDPLRKAINTWYVNNFRQL